jgi:adenosylcobinamide-phosphate synthase
MLLYLATNTLIAILAYLIDRLFGEFTFIRHPISYMGDLITFFEKKFYKDSIFRGCIMVLFVISIVALFAITLSNYFALLPGWLNIIASSIVASIFIAHNMLRKSINDLLESDDQRAAIAMLVSRDTENLTQSDIYKASIETYAENLSDGVIAPLFYLLFFGLGGIIIYKAVNTMDSMVGYRNRHYEKFGKCAARLDDILNYIPSRITALLIMLKGGRFDLFSFYKDGKKHASPNAGHPITAMALVLNLQLGGDTSYFGKVEKKASFGSGEANIKEDDVRRALKLI